MKSSKAYYCHNTNLTEQKGWKTTDRRGHVVILDKKNEFAFCIDFGKKPKMSCFKTSGQGENFVEEVFL